MGRSEVVVGKEGGSEDNENRKARMGVWGKGAGQKTGMSEGRVGKEGGRRGSEEGVVK